MFPLLYRADPAGTGAAKPHIDIAEIARAFTVSATGANLHGHTTIAIVLFALIGAIALIVRDRRTAAVLITMTLIPVAIVIAMVVARHHFFALRYVAVALPPFLILAAIGIVALARFRVLAIAIAVAVMTQTWTAARTEPLQKLNWREIARAIASHSQPGDMLITADSVSDVVLRYYLRDVPHGLKIASIPYVGVAKVVVATTPHVWIASTYNTSYLDMREWTCQFPLLYASDLEGFRLHYSRSPREFLRERAGPAELRVFGAVNSVLDDLFLGEGWAAPDVIDGKTYRWVTATRATLLVPRMGRRDRTLVFHASPMPPQTMRVRVNGTIVGETVVAEGWHDYAFNSPANVWRDGINEIALEFAHTAYAKGDPRPLAVLFDSIRILDGSLETIPPLRMPADRIIGARRGSGAPPDLLLRLGFEPSLRVSIEDAARTVAWGPDCIDDRTFLHRAFETLLRRGPNPIEERDLLARMQRGTPRSAIVDRILVALRRH